MTFGLDKLKFRIYMIVLYKQIGLFVQEIWSFSGYLKISEELCNGIVNTANTNVITNQKDMEKGVGWTPQANKD